MKQVRSFRAFAFAIIASMSSLVLSAQAGDPAVLQQKLYAQFRLTTTTPDRSDIVTPGDVVVIHRPGLLMYAVASPMPPSNTYKNGKISQGWGGFGKDLMITMAAPGGATATDYPHRQFVPEEKCWVKGVQVQKDGVLFQLYSDPYDGLRYYANLKIPFPNKKEMPPVDAVIQTVAEVLTVVRQDDQGDQGGQQSQQGQAQGNAGQSAFVPGRYIDKGNRTDFVQFEPNGTLMLFQSGKTYTGTYSVGGDTIVASGPKIRGQVVLHIVGNTVTYQDGTVYENVAAASQNFNAAAPQAAFAPVAPPPPVALPDIPPPPPPADIAPPPPPSDAPPPTIALGQTLDQVTAGFGQPLRVAKLGAMVIFYYKDMKVTFRNGKVSNVE
jgi:hypothetical protein